MREQGHDLALALWAGPHTPAGVPEAVPDKLDGACGGALPACAAAERMARVAHPIRHLGRWNSAAFTEAEAEKYRAIIEAAGVRQAD